jgi:hypothetical protein
MRVIPFRLTPTETYKERTCAWVDGLQVPCDGLLTVTCVKRNGDVDGPTTYAVERDRSFGQLAKTVRVVVWKIGGDVAGPAAIAAAKATRHAKQRPYVVTVTGDTVTCGCRSRVECKHITCVQYLLTNGII